VDRHSQIALSATNSSDAVADSPSKHTDLWFCDGSVRVMIAFRSNSD
jgi:hypothetical protein